MSECCKAKVVMGPRTYVDLHGLHCESWWVCTACYEPCLLENDGIR